MSLFGFKPRILDSFTTYSRGQLLSDSLAGLVVAVVAALPLAIAFAIASGVSPVVGLTSAIVGGLIIALLSGSRVQIGGPTGSFIVIVYGVVAQYGMTGVSVVTMMAGGILIAMSLMKLGTLIKYVPYPVIIGFTAGMAVIIFSTQVNELLGLGLEKLPADFVSKWIEMGKQISHMHWPTLGLGLLTMLIIQITPRFTKVVPGSLLAILTTTLLVYVLRSSGLSSEIATIGDRFVISGGLSLPSFPSFDFSMIYALGEAAFAIAFLGAIESLLTASIVDGVIGDRHDPNTELMALGVANLITPLMGGMPVTGATARTMTNINNGGRTPMAGIVHALALLVIFLLLMPMISYIPMASLAGVLVIVSYNMSAHRTVLSLLRGPRADAIVLAVTFLLTLLMGISTAIMIGLLLAMLFFIQRMVESTHIQVSRSKLNLTSQVDDHHTQDEEVLDLPEGLEVYEVEGPYFFGIAKHFEELMSQAPRATRVRIIRMRFVPFMDSTAIYNLAELCRSSERDGVRIILSGVHDDVRQLLLSSKVMESLSQEQICSDIYSALSLANTYLSAQD